MHDHFPVENGSYVLTATPTAALDMIGETQLERHETSSLEAKILATQAVFRQHYEKDVVDSRRRILDYVAHTLVNHPPYEVRLFRNYGEVFGPRKHKGSIDWQFHRYDPALAINVCAGISLKVGFRKDDDNLLAGMERIKNKRFRANTTESLLGVAATEGRLFKSYPEQELLASVISTAVDRAYTLDAKIEAKASAAAGPEQMMVAQVSPNELDEWGSLTAFDPTNTYKSYIDLRRQGREHTTGEPTVEAIYKYFKDNYDDRVDGAGEDYEKLLAINEYLRQD